MFSEPIGEMSLIVHRVGVSLLDFNRKFHRNFLSARASEKSEATAETTNTLFYNKPTDEMSMITVYRLLKYVCTSINIIMVVE